jgi:phosphomannomutase
MGHMLVPGIFKAYDVRGLYGSELDEEGAYAIGRAYVEHFEPRSIAVGRDMRVSAPAMAAAVMEGAADGGADVRDLGMVGTEMVYYAVGELGLEGGICVTASHNPKQYTGMKIVRRGALPVGGDSGLEDVRAAAQAGFGPVARRGEISPLDVWPGFVDKVLSFVDVDEIAPLRIVVDAANGMAGAMLPPVLERVPQVEVVRCYFDPDGTFPNHEPNPLLEENRAFIVAKTREEGADLGVAYDGDADRCFFVDDTGEFVPGDFVTALLAEVMLRKSPGGTVLYDVRASWAVPRTIAAAGGTALVNRVGHAFIKHRMRKENAVFAGEVSAHYYFRDFTQADTGIVPFLLMLELISMRGAKLSEILKPFRDQYFITGEINTPVADVPLKLQEIKERYTAEGGRVSHLDGISVDFDTWHFNVRPSNTEPLLRLNLEALSEAEMISRRDELVALIQS